MTIWLSIIALAIALLLLFGFQRVYTPRQTSLEGIESPEAVQAYDRISRWPQFGMLRRMVVRELKRHRPGGTIVDVGCGPGYLVTLIAQSFPYLKIIGIDISEEMMQTAKRNLTNQGFGERVEFRRGDAGNMPLSDASVDFVISSLSLHHWSDPKMVLLEIHRVLKPSGQVLIFDLRRDSLRGFYWLLHFAKNVVLPSAMRHINEPVNSVLSSYTASEIRELLSLTQFAKTGITPGFGWMFIWGQKS